MILDMTAGHAGRVKELGINVSVSDSTLESMMHRLGWRPGQPWCMAYALAVWMFAIDESTDDGTWRTRIPKLTISTQTAWRVAQSLGFRTSKDPVPGSIMILRSTSDASRGHAGIVAVRGNPVFLTVEGNTDEQGGSEGDGVYGRERVLDFSKPQPGGRMKLMGFILPPPPIAAGSLFAGVSTLRAVVLATAFCGGLYAAKTGVLKGRS